MGPHNFQVCMSCLWILGSTKVTWDKFHSRHPQFWNDIWALLLSGFSCSVTINWYAHMCVCVCVYGGEGWTTTIMLKIYGTTVQNLATSAIKCLIYVHKTFSSVQIPRLSHFFAHCQVLEHRLKMFPLTVKVMIAWCLWGFWHSRTPAEWLKDNTKTCLNDKLHTC